MKATLGGKIVRAARKSRGYTQHELSIRTGFALNTIRNWEGGRARPPFDDVVTVCEYLGYEIIGPTKDSLLSYLMQNEGV